MTLRCRLFGHSDGAPMLKAPNVIAVKCAECGRISEGVVVGVVKPKAIVVPIENWKQKGAHRAA